MRNEPFKRKYLLGDKSVRKVVDNKTRWIVVNKSILTSGEYLRIYVTAFVCRVTEVQKSNQCLDEFVGDGSEVGTSGRLGFEVGFH